MTTPDLSALTLDLVASQILDCAEAHSVYTHTGQACISLTELYTYLPGLKRRMLVAKTVLRTTECKVTLCRASNVRAKLHPSIGANCHLKEVEVVAYLEVKFKREGVNQISVRDNLIIVSDDHFAKVLELKTK